MTEGVTALRTLTGNPVFAAPEIHPFLQRTDVSSETYTNAVDIWSLGVLTFLILTGRNLFMDYRYLAQYVAGKASMPFQIMEENGVSAHGKGFVNQADQGQT